MTTTTLDPSFALIALADSLPATLTAQFASKLEAARQGTLPQAHAMMIIRQLGGMSSPAECEAPRPERPSPKGSFTTGRRDDASEAQARYAADLLRTRVAPDERVTGTVKTAADILALFAASGVMDRTMARNIIDAYRLRSRIVEAAPVVAKADAPKAAAVVLEAGMYRVGDTVYKVQKSRQSGRMYAKVLVVHGPGEVTFEYDSGAIRKITPDDRMTLEDAQAFGHSYGVCCNCGALLTDPKSVAMGIGPVCAGRV